MDWKVMDGKLKVLGNYAFFGELRPDLQQEILKVGNEVNVPRGTILFSPGGQCPNVALLGAGSIRVFIGSDSGREVTLYHVGPGETCPINLLSALLGHAVPATAVVESDVHAVVLPKDQCRRWMDAEPAMRNFLLNGLAVRFMEIFQQVNEITFGRLDRRLTDFLSRGFADSRLDPPEIKATHEHIASELGTAREVVSRLLREFERGVAIDLGRGKVTLKDSVRLRQFL